MKDDLLTNIIRHNMQVPIPPAPPSTLPGPPVMITMDQLRSQGSRPQQGKFRGKSIKTQTEKTVKFDFYLLPENGEYGPPKLPKRVDGPGETLFDAMTQNGYIKTLEFNERDVHRDYCVAIIESGFAEFKLNGFQFWKPRGSTLEPQGPPKKTFNLEYLFEYAPSYFNINN
jgi:hypothetical protein